MSNIINRQAAIEEALGYLEGDCFCDETDFRSLINDLENLPSAEPEWIPCSEHLPKKNGTYIVTEKVFSVDDYHHKGKYQIKVEPVDFFGGAFMRAPYFEVLAWMPLPTPYQPKEDES